MKLATLITSLLSALFGVFATITLIWGTANVPWSIRSWSGQSEREIAFRKRTRRYYVIGVVMLALAFALAGAAAIKGYLAP
jgi:hypothetical protein